MTAEYLWRMEQVLDIYERPYDSRFPVVCFDERPCQLLGDVLMPIPMEPGRVQRQDYHYKRKRNLRCAHGRRAFGRTSRRENDEHKPRKPTPGI